MIARRFALATLLASRRARHRRLRHDGSRPAARRHERAALGHRTKCRRTPAPARAPARSSSTATSSSGTSRTSGTTGPITAGHFHGPAEAGANAGVVVPFAGPPDEPDRRLGDADAGAGRPGQAGPVVHQPAHRRQPGRRAARPGQVTAAGRALQIASRGAAGQPTATPPLATTARFAFPLRAGAARGAAPCRSSSSAALDELDLLRVLVGRELAAHVRLQLARRARASPRGPGASTTKALTSAPRSASGLGTTAALATAGCLTRQFSTSLGPMR